MARGFNAGTARTESQVSNGTIETRYPYVSRSFGTWNRANAVPALKRGAIVGRRFATDVFEVGVGLNPSRPSNFSVIAEEEDEDEDEGEPQICARS